MNIIVVATNLLYEKKFSILFICKTIHKFAAWNNLKNALIVEIFSNAKPKAIAGVTVLILHKPI